MVLNEVIESVVHTRNGAERRDRNETVRNEAERRDRNEKNFSECRGMCIAVKWLNK